MDTAKVLIVVAAILATATGGFIGLWLGRKTKSTYVTVFPLSGITAEECVRVVIKLPNGKYYRGLTRPFQGLDGEDSRYLMRGGPTPECTISPTTAFMQQYSVWDVRLEPNPPTIIRYKRVEEGPGDGPAQYVYGLRRGGLPEEELWCPAWIHFIDGKRWTKCEAYASDPTTNPGSAYWVSPQGHKPGADNPPPYFMRIKP